MLHHRLEAVHVHQRDARQLADAGFNVARHGQVHQQERAGTLANGFLHVGPLEDEMGRRRGRNHRVYFGQHSRNALKHKGAGIPAAGQLAGVCQGAAGDDEVAHPGLLEQTSRNGAHLAAANEQKRAPLQRAKMLPRQVDSRVAQTDGMTVNAGLGPHAPATRQGVVEEAVEERASRVRLAGRLDGVPHLAQNLLLARHQRFQAAGYTKEMAGDRLALPPHHVSGQHVGVHPALLNQKPAERRFHSLRLGPGHVELHPVTGVHQHHLFNFRSGMEGLQHASGLPVAEGQPLSHHNRCLSVVGPDQNEWHSSPPVP